MEQTSPNFRLLGDVVAVKRLPENRISKGGIHLAADVINNHIECEITHIGSKCKQPDLSIGKKVLVSIYDASQVELYKSFGLSVYPSEKILALLD